MTTSIRLIVGLGNPGRDYTKTRHNVGFWLIEELTKINNISLNLENKFFGLYGKFKYKDSDIHLLEPQTYMNLSGKSVLAVSGFYKIQPEEILVVHDELDFNPGIVKLKLGGGHAGHNGLRDIGRVLNSKNFWRLRIGIGHPGDRHKVSDYVLNKPSADDQNKIEESITDSIKILDLIFDGNFNDAMKKLHTK